jgi:hypothetical protein
MMRLGLLLMIAFLVGCESTEDKVYSYFKCGEVATVLEHEKEAKMARTKGAFALKKAGFKGDVGAFIDELSQRYVDDLELYKYGITAQMSILNDVYNSSECQSSYES